MLELSYKTVSCEFEDGENVCDYLRRYDIEVFYVDDNDVYKASSSFIGKGIVYLINPDNIELGVDLFDVLDELHYDDMYEVWRKYCDPLFPNILLLDRLEILPEYRGKGFGKMVTANILRFFSDNYGIAILKAFPLQCELFDNEKDPWRSSMKYAEMQQDEKLAEKSLFKLYKAEGFKRYRKSNLFYRLGECEL